MKILILADDMFPGGVQRHVSDLANELAGAGHFVSVAAKEGFFVQRLKPPVEFIPLPLVRKESGRKRAVDFLRALNKLRKLHNERKYDVIHSHQRYSDALAGLLALMRRTPHVSTCHSMFKGGRSYSHFGTQTIAISEAIKQMLVRSYGKRPESVSVLYNEIPSLKKLSAKESRGLIASLGLSIAQKILVSIGRFVSDKDRDTLLDALKILKEYNKLSGVVCVLVGYGEESARLKEKVSTNGLSESVVFLPPTTDIEGVLNLAEFCILSPRSEGGIPYVVLEAASLGKPHLATNVGGIPEFIQNLKTGLLVPPQQPDMLAKSIDILLRNPRLVRKLGVNARKEFNRSHTTNGFIEKTIDIYKSAIRRARN